MIHSIRKAEAPRFSRRELAVAAIIARAVQNAWTNVTTEELASALTNLNASEVNRIVNELSVNPSELEIITELAREVRGSMRNSINNIESVLRGQNARLPRAVAVSNPQYLSNLPASQLPSYLSPVNVNMVFNYTDPRVVLWASTRAGRLIQAIDESTRIAIRQTITRSFVDQITVRETAKILKDVVGLHPRWANAVYDFRIRSINNLLESGLSQARASARADVLTARYRNKLVTARSRMIARTEIQLAQNQGRYLGWVQANEKGLLDGAAQKMWITAYRDVCDVCLDLNGQVVPWNGAFTNGDIMPPAHPNCRCTAVAIPPDRGTFSPEDAIDLGFVEGAEFEE
jgi:hypothetical protein